MLRQAVAQGIGRCFGAVGTAGLGEDVAHMAGDGTEADAQGVGDVPVALACGDEPQHLELARREPVRVSWFDKREQRIDASQIR